MSVHTCKNKREYMEDQLFKSNTKYLLVAGIFDGHGGRYVSESLRKYFTAGKFNFKETETMAPIVRAKYLQTEFERLDTMFRNYGSGSTLCMFISYKNSNHSFIVNVGDSRICFFVTPSAKVRMLTRSKSVVPVSLYNNRFVTVDHSATKDAEFIKSKGGFVRDGRANDILMMSRAYGDGDAKNLGGVIARPDVYIIQTSHIQSNVVISSDGVFEGLTTSDVLYLLMRGCKASDICNAAIRNGAEDNLALMITTTV